MVDPIGIILLLLGIIIGWEISYMLLYELLKDFQTLIAGILALSGASVILLSTKMQIYASKKREDSNNLRTYIVSALSYSEGINILINDLHHILTILYEEKRTGEASFEMARYGGSKNNTSLLEIEYKEKYEGCSKQLTNLISDLRTQVLQVQLLLNLNDTNHNKLHKLTSEWPKKHRQLNELLFNKSDNLEKIGKFQKEFEQHNEQIITQASAILKMM